MHPVLFKLPLPNYDLRYAWILLFVAAVAAVLAITKMIGKEKDRAGALIAGAGAVIAVLVRFGLRYVVQGDPLNDTVNIGNIPIYSYGVMLGLSLVVGWYLTLTLAERDGLPKETMANNYVITAVAALVGARVLYILTNLNEFDSLGSMFAFRRGGLVAYGGFLGGLIGSYVFLRQNRMPLLPWADVAVPSLATGLMITRVGCYLFGCDFGQPLKESAPAFLKKLGTFPKWADGTLPKGSGSPAWVQHVQSHLIPDTATASLPVHPTQIYESLTGLLLFGLLLWARKKQKFRGEIFFLFCFAYGVCRYLLEILRDDAERGSLPPSLPEHILLPLGLGILAIGWVIGFSQAIENLPLRRFTQVIAFVPVVALYFAFKPETFAAANNVQFSTSQFIGITSGFAASVAFIVFYKAALAHPKQAMALNLPGELAPAGAAPAQAPGAVDESDEEEAPVRRPKKTTKTKVKAKSKATKQPLPEPEEETAAGAEQEREPEKKEEPRGGSASEEEHDDAGAGEPVKAS